MQALSNEELRRRKWAQDPDQPHPYRPRNITAKNVPGMAHMLFSSWGDRPCRICGGSRGLQVHAE